MGLIKYFKQWYSDHQHQRLLNKRGWTEEDYQRFVDCRVNTGATLVSEHYHGYAYRHVFETPNSVPFVRYDSWSLCYQEMKDWCGENCQGPWRHDILRVNFDSDHKIYELCDFSSRDAVFFVFENERDYVGFVLKWA